jgi:hypothetical protein
LLAGLRDSGKLDADGVDLLQAVETNLSKAAGNR